ncbi:MAG: tRNA uridine-5-carboxymethylaminomethyl(34) synthesis GTPase MnmE [Puniceicoccales bacterium]|jgi:tRNA modification GTPase|nr:tRNA uridine-5-carboxymethylaminomethyl(34) synthesis GTPase MnmE [Puniceicoccales bacterium]
MALATPCGVAAIAKVRVSGPRTKELVQEIFGKKEWGARHVYHSSFRNRQGERLDEVCWFYFEGEHSYTGEDSLEIDCHGNPLIVQKILEDLEFRACRLAEPGEFTRRAFLNHKIDLCQAEAVLDLIHANNEEALALASQQLSGKLSRKVSELSERLLRLLASVEMTIDFPSEMDDEPKDANHIREAIGQFLEDIRSLQAMQRDSERLKRGTKVVLIGEPNVGKSSLFNCLLRQERALVNAEAGTTRDFISASWICSGYVLELCDTAGLRHPESDLERQGIEKSITLLKEADLALWVVDPHVLEKFSIQTLQTHIDLKRVIRVENKSDLGTADMPRAENGLRTVSVSAKTGMGIDVLCLLLVEKIRVLSVHCVPSYGINERHASVFRRVEQVLASSLVRMDSADLAVECMASDLRLALEILGEITNPYDQEAILDRLFAQFCIGK